MTIKVLALDLESTLITNVINRKARPGLSEFLRFCLDSFEKVVIFTGTTEELALSVFSELDEIGLIPDDFLARTNLIDWDGWYKDLRFIEGYTPAEILIVDDFVDYILPEQKSQWIRCRPYLPEGEDRWIQSKEKPVYLKFFRCPSSQQSFRLPPQGTPTWLTKDIYTGNIVNFLNQFREVL